MKIYACTEARSGTLDPSAFEMLGAARRLAAPGEEVVAFLAAADAVRTGDRLGAADRLVAVETAGVDIVPAETYARLLAAAVERHGDGLVLVPYSAGGLDVAAALAARTGWPLVAQVVGAVREGDGLAVTAQMYGGKILAECVTSLPAVLMVNPGAFPEAGAAPLPVGAVEVLDGGAELAASRIRAVAIDLPDFADVDLAGAERIVCVGRGIGDAASIDLARDLAALIGAEIAGSRPVVDSGWLPKLRQVGKSGQKVKPKLYLALGVSGAPEHLEGMAKSDLVIAVNTDPKAPIFGAAHYGATCDLFDFVASLTDRLRAQAGA